MMKLPWWVWFAAGVPVTVFSSLMGLVLFVWLGLVFLVVGTAKVVYLFVLAPRVPKAQKRSVEQQFAQPEARHCPRCHVAVHANDYFCRVCGQRLRRL